MFYQEMSVRILALLLMLPVLVACESLPRTERVDVPVPTPCRVAIPVSPAQCVPSDTSRAEWLRCALSDCELRKGYQTELEAALKACTE